MFSYVIMHLMVHVFFSCNLSNSKTFQRVLRLCGGRKVLFNNMTKDKVKNAKQVKQLLAHVAAIEKNNGGKPYSNQMHRNIKVVNVSLICIQYESISSIVFVNDEIRRFTRKRVISLGNNKGRLSPKSLQQKQK